MRWILIAVLGIACGKGDSATDSTPPVETGPPTDSQPPELTPDEVVLDGACELADDRGGFFVELSPDGAAVQGSVADGVVPIDVLEEIDASGDCRLLRRNNPLCDPPCGAGETCDFDGTCLPYPANVDLGTVSLAGLTADVVLEPVFPGYTYFDTTLATPPFEPLSVVTLDMPEGTYGPQQVHGVGFTALTVGAPSWEVDATADLVVTWDAPPESPPRSHVALELRIDQHGATPSVLVCAFDDDGEGTVPASLVAKLVDVGVTGFPSGSLTRQTVDRADLAPGCFDLSLTSPVDIDVDVVGFTPCVSDADCPDGQTCNIEFQICE